MDTSYIVYKDDIKRSLKEFELNINIESEVKDRWIYGGRNFHESKYFKDASGSQWEENDCLLFLYHELLPISYILCCRWL